jgi:two-component system, response regulator PdtaR
MLFGRRKRNVKRILIIEDEPLTAFDNECMIRDAGYEVVATHNDYEEAVAALDRGKIDLVLSDVRLRGDRTGIDVAKEAKKRGVPVLFVTGYPPDNAPDLAIGCLRKPYTERTLRKALDAVDRFIGGKSVEPPEGLELFASSEGEGEAKA